MQQRAKIRRIDQAFLIHFLQQANGDDGGLNGAFAQQIEQGVGREPGKAQMKIALGPYAGVVERLITGQIAAEGLRIDGAHRFARQRLRVVMSLSRRTRITLPMMLPVSRSPLAARNDASQRRW